MCIGGIKEDLEVYHSFNEMLSRDKGAYILSKFQFDFSSRVSHDSVNFNF